MGIDARGVLGLAASLADDLLETGRENGGLLLSTIRTESARAVEVLGLGRGLEVHELRQRVSVLEAEVAELSASVSVARDHADPGRAAAGIVESEPRSSSGSEAGMTLVKKRKIYLEDPDG